MDMAVIIQVVLNPSLRALIGAPGQLHLLCGKGAPPEPHVPIRHLCITAVDLCMLAHGPSSPAAQEPSLKTATNVASKPCWSPFHDFGNGSVHLKSLVGMEIRVVRREMEGPKS